MRDLVMAVYRKDCYAGETTLELVDVVLLNGRLPKEYLSCEYELKLMCLKNYQDEENTK